MQPVVRLDKKTGERELTVMRWGLVPYWSKDAKAGFSTINAKAETITTSPAFREAMKYRRCLVPAEWFYEWQKIGAEAKQPYAIGMQDGGLFAFAGLWERWKDRATGNNARNMYDHHHRPKRTDGAAAQPNARDNRTHRLSALAGSNRAILRACRSICSDRSTRAQ